MLECVCEICNKEFPRKKSQIKLALKHYCSRFCAGKGRKNGRGVLCTSCGMETYRSLKNLNGSKSGKYFCSQRCQLQWISKINDGHPNWKGGSFSYRQRLSRESNIKVNCVLCYENDLRMLAVHHIDKNRLNNSLKNLVWLCHNCHFLVHHYKEESKELNQILHGKKV
jgi:hypothetical protein